MTVAQLGSTTPTEPPNSASLEVPAQVPKVVAVANEIPAVANIIRAEATQRGLSAEQAVRIAWCESNHRQLNSSGDVLRGELSPSDVGVFQINEFYHLERSRKLGYNIYTLEGNVGYALWLMNREGTKHWVWSKPCWSA